jgi:hypothetical protein
MSSPTDVGTPPKPHRRSRLLRALITLGVFLIVAEILLRLIFGFASPVVYQTDPDCGYMPKPDQILNRFFCHNNINHAGMRSDEFVTPKPKGTYRVFFIGDSVTYGTTHIDQPLIFTSLVATALHPAGAGHVETLNMSAGGWGPQNEAGYLLSRGTFDSDVVLFVLNTADLAEEKAALTGPDINYPLERPYTALGEVWSRYAAPRLFHQKIAGDAGTTLPAPEIIEQRTAQNFEVMEKAVALCRKSGATIGVVYVPFAGWEKEQIENTEHLLTEWTASQHMPLIDVAPAFAKDDPAALTMDGMHLKAYGHQVVAKEIERQWGVIDEAVAENATQAATQK